MRGIFFDCDGVIVDSEALKYHAWQTILAEEGIPFSRDEYASLVGQPMYYILHVIAQKHKRPLSDGVGKAFKDCYHAMQDEGVPLFHDTIAFIRRLIPLKKEKAFVLGLVSGGGHHEIGMNLRHAGLEGVFDPIVSGEDDLHYIHDPEGFNKPKPYIYLHAAKKAGVSPQHCIAFEDTFAGVEATKSAGMVCVAVPHALTAQQNFSRADRIVSSLSDWQWSDIHAFF